MVDLVYQFKPEEQAYLESLVNANRHAEAWYFALKLVDPILPEGHRLTVFLNNAAAVNANVGPASTFIRTYTREAQLILGGSISEGALQDLSNSIVVRSMTDMINSGGILQLPDFLNNDVGGVMSQLIAEPWQWAGTPSRGGIQGPTQWNGAFAPLSSCVRGPRAGRGIPGSC